MMFSKVAKVAVCIGGTALIASSEKLQAKEMVACHDCHMRRLPKAKELPIYDKDDDYVSEYDEKSKLPLISEISVARKKLFEYASYLNTVQEQAVHIYETGVSHSKSTFDTLKQEENKVQRGLVIASGGLVGLLLARRGGIIKKVFYTSLGTGAVFYIFYPSISKEYALAGWNASKSQINNALTKYGGALSEACITFALKEIHNAGYSTDKIAEETKAKIEYIKSVMKFESVLKMLNEKFYKKDTEPKEDEKKNKESATSNQDMYTTRAAA